MLTFLEIPELRHWLTLVLLLAMIALLVWIGVLLIRLRRLLAGTQQEQRRAIHALGEKLNRQKSRRRGSATRPGRRGKAGDRDADLRPAALGWRPGGAREGGQLGGIGPKQKQHQSPQGGRQA